MFRTGKCSNLIILKNNLYPESFLTERHIVRTDHFGNIFRKNKLFDHFFFVLKKLPKEPNLHTFNLMIFIEI